MAITHQISRPPSRTDVVVIGAGIIGCSIAYHLARYKLQVTVLEQGDIAAGSSGACDGLVFLQSKQPGIHLELAMASRRRFDELAQCLPVPIEFKQTGGMVVVETEDEMAAMERYVESQQQIGLDVDLLDGGRARQLEPRLSGQVLGATHSPLDGQVNPIALTLGFAMAACALGVQVITGTRVTGIDTAAGHVAAVYTDAGRLAADIVVNAAGAHAAEIGKMAGMAVPIHPRRGQIIVTEACPPMIRHCLISARYIAAKYNPELGGQAGEGISIEQTAKTY